jgi:hypothetical protein
MNSIFDIERNILEAIDMLEESGGEITDEISEILNINRDEIKEKLNQYYYVTKKLEGEVELANFEINRLSEKRNLKQKNIDNIKSYVKKALELFGLEVTKSKAKNKPKEVNTGYITAKISYTESLEVDKEINITNVPDELQDFTTVSINAISPYSEYKQLKDTIAKSMWSEKMSIICKIQNISKADIKKEIEEGKEFEYVQTLINEKIEFK